MLRKEAHNASHTHQEIILRLSTRTINKLKKFNIPKEAEDSIEQSEIGINHLQLTKENRNKKKYSENEWTELLTM